MSDSLNLTAQPVDAWTEKSEKDMVVRIQTMVRQEGIERIIVGYPLTLRGEKGPAARWVDRFVGMLAGAVSIPVTTWDERLSSVQAQRIMHQINQKPSRMKGRVDVLASMIILQNYLDTVSRSHDRQGESTIEP
jgi:putative holliday junction resolvase